MQFTYQFRRQTVTVTQGLGAFNAFGFRLCLYTYTTQFGAVTNANPETAQTAAHQLVLNNL